MPPFAQLEIDLEALEQIETREYDPQAQRFPLTEAQSAVLALFAVGGKYTDSELNVAYELLWESKGYPKQHPDSPRRRRSDLSKLGLLTKTGERRLNQYGGYEAVYTLARKGM